MPPRMTDATIPKSGALRMNETAYAPAPPVSMPRAEQPKAVDKVESRPKPKPDKQYTLMEAAGLETPAEVRKPDWNIVGVAFATYILVQSGDTLYAIDQHAAHERILYEKYMRQWESGVQSQMLLTPYTVTVSAAEKAQIMENRELLSEVGFEIDDFGD